MRGTVACCPFRLSTASQVGCVTSPCLPALPWKRACCRVTSSRLLAGDVFQRCCVTSPRLRGTLFTGRCLETSCVIQQRVDMSHCSLLKVICPE
jgi:hypothetical protein